MAMKKIFAIIIVFCASAVTLRAQDAEYKEYRYSITVNADGTSDYNVHKELKLLRLRALSDYGETFVVYNPAFEQVTINEVYTLQADGSKVTPRADAILDILPSSCTACGRFNGMREKVIVHTGLELNATIVLDYTVHRRSDVLDLRVQLQQACPVAHYVLDVKVPQSQQLTVQQSSPLNGLPSFQAEASNHFHIDLSNLQQTLVDSYLPAPELMYNVITFSNGLKPELRFEYDEVAGADALLKELKKDEATEYVVALRDFVRDNIRTNAIAPELLQYQLSAASTVWKSGCGTPEEKAVLLASLLRRAGYQASVNANKPTRVVVVIDNMDYSVAVNDKRAPEPIGVAHEEVKTISIEKDLEWNGTELSDDFYRFVLPTEAEAYSINVSQLTSMRTAPLKTQQCNEQYDYTVKMPRGFDLVGDAVSETIEVKGVGKVEISVRQRGRKIKIHRALRIDKDLITSEDYAGFRRLMQLWSQHKELYVRGK